MTDIELLEALERRFDTKGEVPFAVEEGALVESLSFTSRSLTRDTYRDAWNSFVKEAGVEHLGWPVHFGIAVWYWDHEFPLHAAAVFEHIHRHVRQGYDQAGEVAEYQADYLPRMIQLYAELSDSERISQLFGRLEELYEDRHVGISEYSDGMLAVIGAVEERRGADSDSLLHSARKTILDLRDRLDIERREKEALKAEADARIKFKDVCAAVEADLRARYATLFPRLLHHSQQFLVEACAWNTEAFRKIGPRWSPLLYQYAIEYEFNERVWGPACRMSLSRPSEFRHDRLTINQIYRLLSFAHPLVKGLVNSIRDRLGLALALSPTLATALCNLKIHCTRARHGDKKPYTVADLDVCMKATVEGDTIFQILALFIHAKGSSSR